jgi:hypothetical protein
VIFGDIAAKAARSTTTLSTGSHAHRVGLAPSPHGCLARRRWHLLTRFEVQIDQLLTRTSDKTDTIL